MHRPASRDSSQVALSNRYGACNLDTLYRITSDRGVLNNIPGRTRELGLMLQEEEGMKYIILVSVLFSFL